jgi:hypothetical protein
MWSRQGQQLSFDERDAFRWEVRDMHGVLGFVNADRAMSHPEVMWKRENANCEELDGEYKTVDEAFAAF